MVSRPGFVHTAERRDEVPRYDAGRRPVRSHFQGWVEEVDSSLFERHNGDCSPGDLKRAPLKEGQEEGVPQLILYRLKGHHYVRGDALQEGSFLLEGLM